MYISVMKASEIYNEINAKYPNLVEKLLDKSSTENENERQTIYGDLMNWLRDYYTIFPIADREQVAKLLLGDYVIKHLFCLQKTYIVVQESDVDGEMLFNAVPCSTKEAARKVMQNIKNQILRDYGHYNGYTPEELQENFEIEEDDDRWYINDPFDNYYEDVRIEEKVVVIR